MDKWRRDGNGRERGRRVMERESESERRKAEEIQQPHFVSSANPT